MRSIAPCIHTVAAILFVAAVECVESSQMFLYSCRLSWDFLVLPNQYVHAYVRKFIPSERRQKYNDCFGDAVQEWLERA